MLKRCIALTMLEPLRLNLLVSLDVPSLLDASHVSATWHLQLAVALSVSACNAWLAKWGIWDSMTESRDVAETALRDYIYLCGKGERAGFGEFRCVKELASFMMLDTKIIRRRRPADRCIRRPYVSLLAGIIFSDRHCDSICSERMRVRSRSGVA